jgi:UDP-GlcNAc:undecaprenyl-phosphate/decaprenyl-phosphate GlcNAc-1-phosphate transferase
MRAILVIIFVALMITAVSTPRIRILAISLGFVDIPEERKLHKEPIPLLGGIAIIVGAVLAIFLAVYLIFGTLPRRLPACSWPQP